MLHKKEDYLNEHIISHNVNGLRIYIVEKKGFSKSYGIISTAYGSNDIKFSTKGQEFKQYPLGIAHFLEHKLFEQEEGNIFEKFSALGSSPNAYTNFEETCYYITSTGDFYENLKLLLEMVYNPHFTNENVEKEKGIIEQEIRMYEDNPGAKVYYNAMQCMYKNHPVKNDIAGTVDSIAEITSELLYECYNAFYVPSNMMLLIVGDVDSDKIISLCQNMIPNNFDNKLKKYRYPKENGIATNSKEEDMNLSIPNFLLGFKDNCIMDGTDLMERKIMGEIIGRINFGKVSILNEQLYNKGLINESFDFEYTAEREYGQFFIGGESKDPERVKKIVSNYINDISFVREDTVERIKKALFGAFISNFNSIESIGNCLNYYYLRDFQIFDYLNKLEMIDCDKLKKFTTEIFYDNEEVLSVIK